MCACLYEERKAKCVCRCVSAESVRGHRVHSLDSLHYTSGLSTSSHSTVRKDDRKKSRINTQGHKCTFSITHSLIHRLLHSLPRSLTHMWSIRTNISYPPLFANILNKFGSHIFFSSQGLPETRLAVAADLQTIVGHTTVALLATWRLRTSSEQVPDLCWTRSSSCSCSWHLLAYTVMQGETHFYLSFNQQRTRWQFHKK